MLELKQAAESFSYFQNMQKQHMQRSFPQKALLQEEDAFGSTTFGETEAEGRVQTCLKTSLSGISTALAQLLVETEHLHNY